MNAGDTESSNKVPRRRWGRRKVDWMVPLILLLLAMLAALWAIDNYSKAQQLRQINMALDAQSKLLDRLLEKGDEKRGESTSGNPPSVAVPAPTGSPSVSASPSPTAPPASGSVIQNTAPKE